MVRFNLISFSVSLILNSTPAIALDNHQVFTRRVQQLTGDSHHPSGISGQDSPITFKLGNKVCILFGDTVFYDGRFFQPNSMGCTEDMNASDGLTLTYFKNNDAKAPLPKKPGEFSVWFDGAYVYNNVVFAHYNRVVSVTPDGPVMGDEGIAIMVDPNQGFLYTGIEIPPDHPLAGHIGGPSYIHSDGYIYKYQVRSGYLDRWTEVTRVKIADQLDFSKYEFQTPTGWTTDVTAPRARLLENSNAPSVNYNFYLQKFLAVSSLIFSEGFVSGIQGFSSDYPAGPFSPGKVLINQANHWQVGGEIFQTYNAKHEPSFDRENGRVFYSFATRQCKECDVGVSYNTHLYESQIDFVKVTPQIETQFDDLTTILASGGNSEVALRFGGYSYFGATSFNSTKLTLTLNTASNIDRNIKLKIDLGRPNTSYFNIIGSNAVIKSYIANFPRIASTVVDVFVPARSKTVLVQGPALDALLSNLISSQYWDNYGEKNYIPLYVSRADNVGWSPNIESYESGNPAKLEYCHGSCPQ